MTETVYFNCGPFHYRIVTLPLTSYNPMKKNAAGLLRILVCSQLASMLAVSIPTSPVRCPYMSKPLAMPIIFVSLIEKENMAIK